jgi:hypothetical protein
MHCLRSLGSRDRGFEPHSGHGCLVFVSECEFFCVCVQVEALRRADHPPKAVAPKKKICYVSSLFCRFSFNGSYFLHCCNCAYSYYLLESTASLFLLEIEAQVRIINL